MNAQVACRAEDASARGFTRDDRYFSLDGKWYFTTREGLIMGPFDSRDQALSEADTYIRFVKSVGKSVINIIKRGKLANQDSYEPGVLEYS